MNALPSNTRTASFLAPTRAKVTLTAAGFLVFPGVLLLRAIPPQWDILDLREWSGILPTVLLGIPIRLFDFVTNSAFASRGEGYIVFPSLPEIAAAFLADTLLFYVLACFWVRRRDRRRVDQEPRGLETP